jgi:hypothetical protein
VSRRRRRNAAIGATAAIGLAAAIVSGIYAIGGGEDTIAPTFGGPGSGLLTLDLQASRDFGALAPRGTDAGQWCGPVNGLPAPAHCWELQQSSGDATDYGAVGGWHLSPAGSIRVGVPTGLPVGGGAAVDWSSELGTWADGSATAALVGPSSTLSATDLVSVTVLFRGGDKSVDQDGLVNHRSVTGWAIYITAAGKLAGRQDLGVITPVITSTSTVAYGIHCATVVLDARTDNAGSIYLNGLDDSATSGLDVGDFASAANALRIHGWADAATWSSYSGVIRARIDANVAVSLAQHRAMCGSWGLPVSSSHRTAPDHTWTQSGGARCYPSSATTAACYPGGAPAARWTATGWEWAADAQGSTNRLLWSTAMDCTNWGCVGVASGTPGQVAPDGSPTASTIVVAGGANHFEQDIASGYTPDASPLHLTMWAKCSTGVFHPHGSNDGTRGDWDVSCSCIGGVWRHLDAKDACVTVNVPFNAGPSGEAGLHFDGTLFPLSADIWAPTLTEEFTTGAVIPTGAAAVSTGTIAWSIDNSSSRYWTATSTVTQSVSTVDGTCIVPGSTFWLGGATSSECVGGVDSVQVRR